MFAGIGAIAYLLALLATLPARFLLDLGPRWAIGGTIWNGEAVLDGAWRVEWRWAPLRTVAALAFSADVRMTGAGTDVAGTASIWRHHMLFEGLAGRGDAALLTGLVPSLPFSCDGGAQIDIRKLALAGPDSAAVGEIRLDGGTCSGAGGVAAAAPAMLFRAIRVANTTQLDLAPAGQPRLKLVEGQIANGRIHVAPTPVGLRTLPLLRALSIDEAL